jgi:hypothetical protein
MPIQSPPLRRLLFAAPVSLALTLACGGGSSSSSPAATTVSTQTTGTVAGTVSYTGTQTGSIYVTLISSTGGVGIPGTTLAAPGPFTITGVPPGTYSLSAAMDVVGNLDSNANAPTATLAALIESDGDALTGLNLTLADPAVNLASLAGPAFTIAPMAAGAALEYTPLYTTLASGLSADQATSYTVEWSAAASFQPIAGHLTFAALGNDSNLAFLSDPSLVPGQAFYFRMRASNAGGSSANNTLSGPVTLAAASGGNPVTGTVSFAGAATGPLYVACTAPGGAVYATAIAAPVSPQSFTIPGVPAGYGTLTAALDQNNDGVIDAGDLSTLGSWNPPIPITASTPAQALTLPAGNALALVTTYHSQDYGSDDDYQVGLTVTDLAKHVTAVTVLSGPDSFQGPATLSSLGQGFLLNTDLGSTVPVAGTSYTVQVGYADGSTETLTPQVTGIVAAPQNLSTTAVGNSSGTGLDVKPTFTWAAPAAAPASYSYLFYGAATTTAQSWTSSWFPSTVTSISYGTDPINPLNSTTVPLVVGQAYDCYLVLADSNGNQGMDAIVYTP